MKRLPDRSVPDTTTLHDTLAEPTVPSTQGRSPNRTWVEVIRESATRDERVQKMQLLRNLVCRDLSQKARMTGSRSSADTRPYVFKSKH